MSNKFTSEYVTIVKAQCMGCEWLDVETNSRCLAYPKGIPIEILSNKVIHDKPYKGDHGFQFKKKVQ